MLTGESLPVDKRAGTRVYAGTLNQQGTLTCVAQRVGAATALAAIIRQVGEAQGSRAPVQALADRVSAVFVPDGAGARRGHTRCHRRPDRRLGRAR